MPCPLWVLQSDGAGHGRRNSFNRLKDVAEPHWRSSTLECWVASDASAVVEHTKK